jgi:deoxyadenosine/deoxycytidine kinase
VPQTLTIVEEELDPELFHRYSDDPHRYAFSFQMWCLAQRLQQQSVVDAASGLVLLGQPIAIDRAVFAEANRAYIGKDFPIYEALSEQVSRRVTSPDVWVYFRVPPERIDVLLRRIEVRGREGEKQFLRDSSYLQRIVQLNEEFFRDAKFPVITVDATHPFFDGEGDDEYFRQLFASVAADIRRYRPPHRLTLEEWEAVDHNQAQKAAWEAERQLRKYLAQHMRCISLAGLPGTGKTGLAELFGYRLDIAVLRELDGRNDSIGDRLLEAFLWDKPTHCYSLQKHLGPKRITARRKFFAAGRSFVEDRTPDEDQAVFHRRFLEQGYLTEEQFTELRQEAIARYREAPSSHLMIKLTRTPREARQMILKRGRLAEFTAWPEEELEALDTYYERLFDDVAELGSHDGPILECHLAHLDTKNEIHRGYLFQEMLHSMMEYDARRGDGQHQRNF